MHAYAAGAPSSTRSQAVSAQSTAPRAASQVPGPIGVIVSNAKFPARADADAASERLVRADETGVREDVRDDAVLARVVRVAGRDPELPRVREEADELGVVDGEERLVAVRLRLDHRRARSASASRIASARSGTSSAGYGRPIHTSPPGSCERCASLHTTGICSATAASLPRLRRG